MFDYSDDSRIGKTVLQTTSDAYRKYLPGLVLYSCDYPAHRPMGHAIYVVSA